MCMNSLQTQQPLQNVIMKQYTRSLKKIVSLDFPQAWPELFDQCMLFLNQQAVPNQQQESGFSDESQIITGLRGLKALCQKYEYEQNESERQAIYQIFDSCVGILGDLVNSVVGIVDQSENAIQILYIVCKIIYSVNKMKLAPSLMMQPGSLDPWIQFMKTILDRPVPLS